jgi:hypothetical protein
MTTEFAKVESGIVVNVIVADQSHVDTRDDGPWVLTPYDGNSGAVGVGYKSSGSLFISPIRQALSLAVSDNLSICSRAVSSSPVSYQWRKNSSDIVGATECEFNIASVVADDSGEYTCMVSDGTTSLESNICSVVVS